MRIVVIGGGIAGLAAAQALAGRAEVTVVEAGDRVGGKLRTAPVPGLGPVGPDGRELLIEEGAESFLARVPDAGRLARAVGLGHDIVHPATSAASLWIGGRLRPVPARTLLGVPTDLFALVRSRVVSPLGLARMAADTVLPRTTLAADPTVGGYVGARVGRQIVDRLVDPLLGGVYAGQADRLSLYATVPQLVPIVAEDRSLLLGARRVRARTGPAASPAAPVFGALRGGMGAFAARVADESGARILVSTAARSLRPTPAGGWEVVVASEGGAGAESVLPADGVVLAVPAAAARRLLAPHAPHAAGLLADVPYASTALVTLIYRNVATPPGSGVLVPATEGAAIKAVTFLSAKWPHMTAGTGLTAVRASVGRAGESAQLERPDVELAGVAAAEVAAIAGFTARPLAWRVSRWVDGLPQYLPGHLGRVEGLRRSLPSALAVAGAAYDGVGIPACIRSGEAAAEAVFDGASSAVATR
ncbi:MAG: protoporphyrinogen oxidase [Frankia sp.]